MLSQSTQNAPSSSIDSSVLEGACSVHCTRMMIMSAVECGRNDATISHAAIECMIGTQMTKQRIYFVVDDPLLHCSTCIKC